MSDQTTLCPYFGHCGGCTLQHLDAVAYAQNKQAILAAVISRLGIDASVMQPLVQVGWRARRRADFKVQTRKGSVQLGYHAAKSHEFVAIDDCPVTSQTITDLIAPIREALSTLKKPGNVLAVHLTATQEGTDLMLSTRSPMSDADCTKLTTSLIGRTSIIRISEQADSVPLRIITSAKPVHLKLGDVLVSLPPHAFLQATQIAQDAITQFVLRHAGIHKNVIDLYCGCGTYALPLAQNGCHVTACEGSEDMVAALHNAALQHTLAKLNAQVRDLIKDPVPASELNRFDIAILNPPRNGAGPQVRELAKSNINNIVMVSCNPATFERDAKTLLQSGFVLKEATPIDQFYQTHHLELVAFFERPHH